MFSPQGLVCFEHSSISPTWYVCILKSEQLRFQQCGLLPAIRASQRVILQWSEMQQVQTI